MPIPVIEDVWVWTCDTWRIGERFRIRDIVGHCPAIRHLSPRYQADIVRATFNDAMRRNRDDPPIARHGPFWWLT